MKKMVSVLCFALLLSACGAKPAEQATSDTPAQTTPVAAEQMPTEADVLVIGGGGAGMTAALAAAEQGRTVLLLEKDAALGGTLAESGLSDVQTSLAEQVSQNPSITTQTDTKAAGLLLTNEGAVRGVSAERKGEMLSYECKAVILATGLSTEQNKMLLSALDQDEAGALIISPDGQVQRKPEQAQVPKKCGVPLPTADKDENAPAVPSLDAPALEDATQDSAATIAGVYAAGRLVQGGSEAKDGNLAKQVGAAAAQYAAK